MLNTTQCRQHRFSVPAPHFFVVRLRTLVLVLAPKIQIFRKALNYWWPFESDVPPEKIVTISSLSWAATARRTWTAYQSFSINAGSITSSDAISAMTRGSGYIPKLYRFAIKGHLAINTAFHGDNTAGGHLC